MATFSNRVLRALSKVTPKFNTVLLTGNEKVESNIIAFANYVAAEVDIKVHLLVSKEFEPYILKLVDPKVQLISNRRSLSYYWLLLTTKYVFGTHATQLEQSSRRSIDVNIWHGVLYKNIRKLRGEQGWDANTTVGTSPLSQKQFSEAFGVTEDSVLVSGYPRNDMMLETQIDKESFKKKHLSIFDKYDKIVFWMPTFRRIAEKHPGKLYDLKTDNPFQVKNFDINAFNEVLKQNNAICLLKPHYFYMTNNTVQNYSNIQMIDDEWIVKKEITLYQLLACTDVLLSDFSSVLIDYTLMNQPMVCFCTDLEEYKDTQGLYFDDIEAWLPSKLIQDQGTFFEYLNTLLRTGIDPFAEKRENLRDVFFTHKDSNSSKRISEHIFPKKLLK